MTPAEQLLAQVGNAAQRLGIPFVIVVHDAATGKAKMSASAGALEQLARFLHKQVKPHLPDEVPEVGWNDT